MTPERYERVRTIYLQARDLPSGERAGFLSEACCEDRGVQAEVESLLAHADEAETFLQNPVLGSMFADQQPEAFLTNAPTGELDLEGRSAEGGRRPAVDLPVPDRIGQYSILGVLGEGGMGVVYRARQERPRRSVALKVIRPGIESREVLRRFEHETEVLGWLRHPGIAQIYEAGTADTGRGPQPFFAMELVEGRPLMHYATETRIGLRDRLALMARICDAVQHAHQKGVVHRDLKPGNILVDESGQPKILDFGVARITDAERQVATLQTAVGQVVGTLAYMSPEQIAGDQRELDTRSDIYTLGVILYELLSGRVPLDVARQTLPQAARTIAETEPPRLGSLNRFLRGDVETIVGKALEKDKSRRYQSASDLAADIRRFLTDQPINARPATTFYQIGKFARRNRALVAAVVIGFLGIVGGLVHVTLERNRAVRAERLAEQRRERAETAEGLAEERSQQAEAEAEKFKTINRFFNKMLAAARPTQEGRDVRVVDVLEQAATEVDAELTGQTEIAASLRNTIGTVYIGLGKYAEAEPHLRAALAIRRELLGEDSADTFGTMANLAAAIMELGKLSEAEALLRAPLETWRRELGPEHPFTLSAMNKLADVLQRQRKLPEAEALWREALEVQRRVLEPDDPELAITMSNLGQLYNRLGRPADAERLLREAVQRQLENFGPEHPDALKFMANLAMTLRTLGQEDEAETLLRQVVATRRRTLGEHPSVYISIGNLARLLHDTGRLGEAETLTREAVEGFRRTLGEEHPRTLASVHNLGSVWIDLGRAAEAERLYAELLDTARRTLRPGHYLIWVFQRNHGQCLIALERYEEAESLLLASQEGLEVGLGAQHRHTRQAVEQLVALYEAWGRAEEARRWRETLAAESTP